MLKRLKDFLNSVKEGDETSSAFHDHQIAAAALMVEAATLDGNFDDDERSAIERILGEKFDLSKEDIAMLIKEAEAHQNESNHLLRFTRAIKDHYPHDKREDIIEMLWEVAYADGKLDPYEDNLLRRIGGLIYVSERQRGEIKKRVLARLGIDE